jgi:flagellar basal body-associated protein FliL
MSDLNTIPPLHSNRTVYIIIGITILILLIWIGIVIYSLTSKKLLFPEYKPPSNSVYYYPGGAVIQLTEAEIAHRKAVTTPPTTS